ncbi:MAG: hypothetical protein J2P46_18060, partial [Zavarzinella sp.]|nr:hypothetical protein [Zavarzinella sp.]
MALPCPRRRPARMEALCAVGGFLVLTIAFVLAAEVWFPEWYDREYTVRRQRLHERIAEAPDRPLLAVIGSSRAGTDISPECLPPLHDAAGRQVLVFNYSHYGAGPRMNLVQFRRLLRDGIRPTWLVVELLPAHLRSESNEAILSAVADFPALLPYVNRSSFLVEAARIRWDAPYRWRTPFLRTAAPEFATQAGEGDDVYLGPFGDDRNFTRPGALSGERRAHQFKVIEQMYAEPMRRFRIDPLLAEAARDLLRECRDRGISTVLLIGPEDRRFRSWYGPGVEDAIRDFYTRLGEEFDVPVVDARDWSAPEDFLD